MDVIIDEIEFVEDISILDEREKYWIKSFSDNKLSNINNYKKCKSNPIGVRFDLQKLEMIQKEQKLTSVQQVVNYLMDNYGRNASKSEDVHKNVQIPVQVKEKPNLEPPSHLTGIDLIIWKAENQK